MADDDGRPFPEPPRVPPSPPADATPPSEPALPDSALEVSEPTMGGAGADLAADRPAEAFAPEPATAAPRRSLMPALLATIGVVLIVLLGANLYLMANPPGREAIPDLQAAIGGLKQRVAALETRPAVTAVSGQVEQRLKALDASVAGLASAGATAPAVTARLDALDTNVTGLKATVAALPKPDTSAVEARVADINTALDRLKDTVAALPQVDLAPLNAKIAAMDDRLKPIEAAFSAPKIAANVTEARQEGSASETRAAPLAVTAQAILQALDDGQPFAPAVATLEKLGVAAGTLAPLQAVADKGAPTRDALLSGFAAVRDPILQATAPKVTGTVLDRVMASAQSIVQVRDAGASPGSDASAIVARLSADLQRNAFGAALGEWRALPDAGKAASSAWGEQLTKRVDAEMAARTVASTAVAAIGAAR